MVPKATAIGPLSPMYCHLFISLYPSLVWEGWREGMASSSCLCPQSMPLKRPGAERPPQGMWRRLWDQWIFFQCSLRSPRNSKGVGPVNWESLSPRSSVSLSYWFFHSKKWLGRPRGIGWRGRGEGGSGWGIHVNPWLIHVNVWQKPLQYCKVISLQLIKISGKKKGTIYKVWSLGWEDSLE